MSNELKIFGGTANTALTNEICEYLDCELGKSSITRFSDGEIYFQILENVRGADVFIVQPTCPPVDSNFFELFLMIDAFKRASAKRITAVLPYFGYARQDRKDKPRVPISSKVVSDLLVASGTDRLLTMDLACAADPGLLQHPGGSPVRGAGSGGAFSEAESAEPDGGFSGCGRCGACPSIRKAAECGTGDGEQTPDRGECCAGDECHRRRQGQTCLVVDDIIDTAGTLVKTAEALLKDGATKVYACCTHPVLSGPAVERIENSDIVRSCRDQHDSAAQRMRGSAKKFRCSAWASCWRRPSSRSTMRHR